MKQREQEAPDRDDGDDSEEQRPARHVDELVVDVLHCLDADERPEHGKRDDAGEERFLQRYGDRVALLWGRVSRRLALGGGDASFVFDLGADRFDVVGALKLVRRSPRQTFSTSGRPSRPEGRKISTIARMEKEATSL